MTTFTNVHTTHSTADHYLSITSIIFVDSAFGYRVVPA